MGQLSPTKGNSAMMAMWWEAMDAVLHAAARLSAAMASLMEMTNATMATRWIRTVARIPAKKWLTIALMWIIQIRPIGITMAWAMPATSVRTISLSPINFP